MTQQKQAGPDGEQVTLAKYIRNDVIMERFELAVGKSRANSFVSSVLLMVANTDSLHDCTFQSIVTSALRAGALRLSVDPALKQAYLVPFYNKGKQEATLIVSYKGLYDMAVRTREYVSIHDYLVPKGQRIDLDPFTGLPEIVEDEESPGGWCWTMIMTSGYRKSLYMSFDEIHAHKTKYSQGWEHPKSSWSKYPEAMEKKTPLRILLTGYGYFGDGKEADLIKAIETGADDEVIDGLVIEPGAEIEPGPIYEDTPETKEEDAIKSARNDSRVWSVGALETLVNDGIFQDIDFAKNALGFCCIENENHIQHILKWGRDFMGCIDQNYTPVKAGEIANNRYKTALRKDREKSAKLESESGDPREWGDDTLKALVDTGIFSDFEFSAMSLNLSHASLTPASEYEKIEAWALDFKEARSKEYNADRSKNVANNRHKIRENLLK